MTGKEALEHIIFETKMDKPIFSMYYQDFLKPIEKDLDTLKIIKDKKVDVPYIIENPEEKDVIWYNTRFMGVLCEGWRMLSQEEYDLLREVLLND